MKFLITGGAGYIGTNLANYLLQNDCKVVVLDNLELGNRELIPEGAKLYEGDLRNKEDIEKVFSENRINAVFHLAAYSSVQESMEMPYKYFDNNTASTLTLLEAMVRFGIKYIIFSSSAAVYGNAQECPIKENQPLKPNSVYGQTKKTEEELLEWYDKIYGIKFVSLRYFNAAGADYGIGEKHKNETHLIPTAIEAALKKKCLTIFGNDYPTKDGTAIRDYIYVTDLSRAHLLAFRYLEANKKSGVFNIGSGRGNSVKEIVNLVEQISNREIRTRIESRRKGDPPILTADYSKAERILGWSPQKSTKEIIKSAYEWHKKEI